MPIVTPTNAFIRAQRYGAMLVLARFTTYVNGIAQGTPYTANVSSGTFTIDRNSEFRRTGQITIEVLPTVPPQFLTPTDQNDILAPFGNEIFVETGIAPAGQLNLVQWVPMGIYAITTSTIADTGIDMTVTLNLHDRAWTIAQRTFKNPYNFPATGSGNFVTEITALLNQVWTQNVNAAPLTYNIVPTNAVVPVASYNQGSDPWQAALDMAAACGYELYFGSRGMVNGHPIPIATSTAPCWNFTDNQTDITGLGGTQGGSSTLFGSPYSTPIEIEVSMTREGVFNDIIIQGTGNANASTYTGVGTQASGPPILAEAADLNPLSYTYVGGGMGDVPNFVSSSLVTNAGAQNMANTDLQVALSATWTATIACAPNPIFDIDDVVTITRPRVNLNNAYMVIDTITHTISYGDMMQMTGRIFANTSNDGD